MNIKALRAFRATLSGGSLAAAAEKLHLSQPAVSRLITSLEGELKLDLFDRTGRNLTPTEEGMAFYREAGRILDNLDEVPRIVAEIRAGRTQTLRVIAMPRVSQGLACPAVAAFLQQYPDINVSLDVRARREAGEWLVGREYDIGVGALPVDHPDIHTEVLLRARPVAILPVDHPLAQRDELRAEDLAEYPVIRLMRGLLLREQLDDIFSAVGIVPRHLCDVSSSQVACQLVADGAGITIADQLVAANTDPAKVATVPVIPKRWMAFGLLYPKASVASPARDAFIHQLRLQARQLAEEFTDIETVDAS
ncbi:LysR family transcriptional regulator [Aliamphritea spongicola]|uniref:LysR family transcriptional regulator n=1 Tax=Aliamphritea spongicola TaxID=707589 RepID=UPI00196A69E1|nr:LysR family transcriptional regulator [Aliamphritea spongicola]MBN3564337.1 LysR family transcriptional regulator [Aliamphritea spongicola]